MAINANYVNNFGVEVRFGGVDSFNYQLGIPENCGEALMSAYVDMDVVKGLPGPNFDTNGDGTADSFTDNVAFIPAGSLVTGVFVIAKERVVGGNLAVDLVSKAGATLLTGPVLTVSEDSDSAVAVTRLTGNAYLKCTPTAPLTAGKVRVVVTYVTAQGL